MYEYFSSKEDLLFAIPGKITAEAIDFIEQILPYIRGAEGKIKAIVQNYLTVCQNNPEYTSLVMLQLKTNKNFRLTEAFKIIRKGSRILLDCIREGIDDGTFKSTTDPYLEKAIILGTIEHLCTRWRMKGSPGNLIEHGDRIVDSVLHGIVEKKDARHVSLHLELDDETRDESVSPDAPDKK
jgi:TetR/AcrR family fatty acid metabolism transcriptional regulator